MLYTVGRTEAYEQGLNEESVLRKLGRGLDHDGNPYEGGCVFLSVEEAEHYIVSEKHDDYSVYGLLTSVDNTHQLEGESFKRILAS